MTETTLLKQRILKNASQCVKCGLCAPHCPTYAITFNENESSRGRISLAENLAADAIPLTPNTLTHLDHCLTCRACEAVCPSDVQYGAIIDDVRELLATQPRPSPRFDWLTRLLSTPRRVRATGRFMFSLQKIGLMRVAHWLGITRMLGVSALSRSLTFTWPMAYGHYPASTRAPRATLGLFLGCVNQWTDKTVYHAALQCLNALGYAVIIAKQQTCCGALWQHGGDSETFNQKQQCNAQALQNMDAIISVASGCTATLNEYNATLPKVWEITDFLAQELEKNPLRFAPLDKTMAIHIPCTQRHVLKAADVAQRCLRHIPDLKCTLLTDSTHCCGAAGLNMLTHPETAEPLAAKALSKLSELKPDMICTTNIGCQLHLHTHTRAQGIRAPWLHPVVVLAQQLQSRQ